MADPPHSPERWVCPNCGSFLGNHSLRPGSSFERVCHHCKSLCVLEVDLMGRTVQKCVISRAWREGSCGRPGSVIACS